MYFIMRLLKETACTYERSVKGCTVFISLKIPHISKLEKITINYLIFIENIRSADCRPQIENIFNLVFTNVKEVL